MTIFDIVPILVFLTKWVRTGATVSNGSFGANEPMDVQESDLCRYTMVLILDGATAEDAGEYTLVATNDAGSASATFQLRILGQIGFTVIFVVHRKANFSFRANQTLAHSPADEPSSVEVSGVIEPARIVRPPKTRRALAGSTVL